MKDKSTIILIILLVFIAVFASQIQDVVSTTGQASSQVKCTSDTDGGLKYDIKGTITMKYYTWFGKVTTKKYTDLCVNAQTLREYYCGGNYKSPWKDYTCPNGCLNGACKAASSTCTDSDGGKVYYTKGTITGDLVTPNPTREDICAGDSVREMFCNAENKGEPFIYDCPNGCLDGACKVPSNVTFLNVVIEYSDNEDLSDVGLSSAEKVVHIFAPFANSFSLKGNIFTNEILVVASNNKTKIFYRDVEQVPDIVYFGEYLSASESLINYQGTVLNLEASSYSSITRGLDMIIITVYKLDYTMVKDGYGATKAHFGVVNSKIVALGNTLGLEEPNELIWRETKTGYELPIGTRTADFITNYGIIVKTPKTNGASDRVSLGIPSKPF